MTAPAVDRQSGWASGAAGRGFASGTRTRSTRLSSGGSLTVSNHPFGVGAITCNFRPIEIENGQGDGIRTRTVRVTGGDANYYITTLKNWHAEPKPGAKAGPPGRIRTDE